MNLENTISRPLPQARVREFKFDFPHELKVLRTVEEDIHRLSEILAVFEENDCFDKRDIGALEEQITALQEELRKATVAFVETCAARASELQNLEHVKRRAELVQELMNDNKLRRDDPLFDYLTRRQAHMQQTAVIASRKLDASK